MCSIENNFSEISYKLLNFDRTTENNTNTAIQQDELKLYICSFKPSTSDSSKLVGEPNAYYFMEWLIDYTNLLYEFPIWTSLINGNHTTQTLYSSITMQYFSNLALNELL